LTCVDYPDPQVTYHGHNGNPHWELTDDWGIRFPDEWGTLRSVSIGAGFCFDLASIPRLLWWLVAPFELSLAAPLLHDYLYRVQVRSRRESDRLFRLVMRCEKVGWLRRWVAWLAVRVFGWFAWRK